MYQLDNVTLDIKAFYELTEKLDTAEQVSISEQDDLTNSGTY